MGIKCVPPATNLDGVLWEMFPGPEQMLTVTPDVPNTLCEMLTFTYLYGLFISINDLDCGF